VLCLEASNALAGMAATEVDEHGHTFDLGAHFITNRLAASVGIGARCRPVRRYAEVVRLDGRTRGYPLGLLAEPRFAVGALAARLSRRGAPADPPDSAAEAARRAYGAPFAETVAVPLLEKWSGRPATELAAAALEKVPGSVAGTVGLWVACLALRRAVAIGYCATLPQSPWVHHVYPQGGVATVCEALAAQVRALGGRVETGRAVERIVVEGDRVIGVRTVDGAEIPTDRVVSTVPITHLDELCGGHPRLAPFRQLRFRPLVLVNLVLTGRDVLPDVMVWFPDDRPIFRATETTRAAPWLAPDGHAIVVCDLGAEVGDDVWGATDHELAAACTASLADLVPDVERRVLEVRVMRAPLAYPLFLRSTEALRRRIEAGTGIAGLLSAGRNGRFRHDLMEDVHWRTHRLVDAWLTSTASGSTAPGTAAPGTAASGTAASGTAASGTAAPGTAAPGSSSPGSARPGSR
jgi:protoporphyrinogen oxidase